MNMLYKSAAFAALLASQVAIAEESGSCEPPSHQVDSHQVEVSPFIMKTRTALGVNTSTARGYGAHINNSGSSTAVQYTGPYFAIDQSFVWTDVLFAKAKVGATVGTSEAVLSYTKNGFIIPLRSKTRGWDLGFHAGADLNFHEGMVGVRPRLGFTFNRIISKNLMVDPTSTRGDYTLFQMNFYQPTIGVDLNFIQGSSSAKFGASYALPWSHYRGSDPDAGITLASNQVTEIKNRYSASRMGFELDAEFAHSLTSGIDFFAGGSLSSIYVRGRDSRLVDSVGEYASFFTSLSSFKGYMGFAFSY